MRKKTIHSLLTVIARGRVEPVGKNESAWANQMMNSLSCLPVDILEPLVVAAPNLRGVSRWFLRAYDRLFDQVVAKSFDGLSDGGDHVTFVTVGTNKYVSVDDPWYKMSTGHIYWDKKLYYEVGVPNREDMMVPINGNEIERLWSVNAGDQDKVFVDKIDVVNRLKYRIAIKASQKQAAQLVVDDNCYRYVIDGRIQILQATLKNIFSANTTIKLDISKYGEYSEEIKICKFEIRGNEITPTFPRMVIIPGGLKLPRGLMLIGENIVRRDLLDYMCDPRGYNSSHLGFFHYL